METPSLEELAKANEEFNEENKKLRKQLAAANARVYRAKKRLETEEQQIGQDGIARLVDGEMIKPETRTLDDPNMLKKLEIEKFMAEPITIEISDVAEDQADFGFNVEVNGHIEAFRRGEQKIVKRYIVEGLARAKKTGYKCQLVTDPQTGIQEYVYPAKTGLRYPFSVIHDPNPQGGEWLKAVLRQP